MKKLTILLLAATVLGTACRRENNEEKEVLTQTAEDQAMAQGLWDDVDEQVEGSAESVEAEEETWNQCAVLLIDTMGDPFPLEVTVDFGDGCEGRDGRVRKGLLRYTITDWLRKEGASITTSPENYFVDDYQVEGTRVVSNLGENQDGNLEYEIKVSDAKVTDPDGESVTWESERLRTWVEGQNTGFFTPDSNGGYMGWEGITDDVYEITGKGSGTNRNGRSFSISITEALRVQLDCRWITKGMIELTPEGISSRILDYGDGDCDDKAVLIIGEDETEINLRR